MPATRKIELGFFFLLVAAATVVSFLIFKPYFGALFVAVVFAIVFRPLFEALHRRVNGKGLAALLTLVFLFCVILIPATLFGFLVFDDARNLYESAGAGATVISRFDAALQPIELFVRGIIPGFELNVSAYINAALSFLVNNLGGAFTRAIGIVFQTFIMLFALFYLFRDGEKFRSYIVTLSPLTNEYDERILKRIEGAISSVVKGKLLIIFIQGILAAIGVAVVFVPAVIYLFITGGIPLAIGLLILGVIVGSIDNILGPILYEKGLSMHPLFILLSVLGGIALFGPVGFLAGPVAISLLLALLDIYPLLFQSNNH